MFVLGSSSFKKQVSNRPDYCFHYYFELCQFLYCLLSRSQKLSSLLASMPGKTIWMCQSSIILRKLRWQISCVSMNLARFYGVETPARCRISVPVAESSSTTWLTTTRIMSRRLSTYRGPIVSAPSFCWRETTHMSLF